MTMSFYKDSGYGFKRIWMGVTRVVHLCCDKPAHQNFPRREENSEMKIPEAAKLIEILQEK